ncbi:MAG: hypothetical protein IPK53_08255 [bacterium]|nr:hypothetical protein [bacterium]
MNGVAFISTAKQADLLADLTGSDTSLSLFQIISLADLKATIFNTALLLVDEASLPVGDISATTLLDFISSASFPAHNPVATRFWRLPAICLLEAGIERYLGPDHAEAELRFTLQILLKGAGLIPI